MVQDTWSVDATLGVNLGDLDFETSVGWQHSEGIQVSQMITIHVPPGYSASHTVLDNCNAHVHPGCGRCKHFLYKNSGHYHVSRRVSPAAGLHWCNLFPGLLTASYRINRNTLPIILRSLRCAGKDLMRACRLHRRVRKRIVPVQKVGSSLHALCTFC